MTEPSAPARLTWSPPTGIHGFLAAAAARGPERPFLRGTDRSLSYGEAWEASRRLASWLASRGVERGDRVVIHLRNRTELPVALFAASLLGAIHVVLNAKLRPAGAAKILAQCEPKAVIADADCLENLTGIDPGTARLLCGEGACAGWTSWDEAVAAEPWEQEWPGIDVDPASLVFTSGSTGTPRGVTLTHANILFVTGAIQERLGYREDDVVGCFLPMSFDYGLYQIFLAAQAGACLQVGDPDQVGPAFPGLLRQAGVTVLPGVPTMFAALLKLHDRRPFALPDLRAVTNTGERLPPAYIEKLRAKFPALDVFVMFGLTECKRVSILRPEELDRKGDTVGRALAGTEVYAADAAGNRLPPGTVGELVVRGRHVALGYWRAPEETARRFRKRAPEAAVELFTGDQGSVDEEGFIRFAARADDLIKHRGHRLSPVEVENEACAVPGVAEAGLLHRDGDDTLHLFVSVSDPGLGEEAILAALGASLEPAKVPDVVHVRPELPRSMNGKIDRKALRAWLEASGEEVRA
jgi:acyl-CoA synthetase (AMP-forming)/AMP-acid ligase II